MRITNAGTVVLVSGRTRNNAPPPDQDPKLEEIFAFFQAQIEGTIDDFNDQLEAAGLEDDAFFTSLPCLP